MEGMGRLFWTLGREWIDRLIFLCLCGKIAVCNIRPRLPHTSAFSWLFQSIVSTLRLLNVLFSSLIR